MPVEIPFEPTTPNYRMGVVLGGTQYIFDVRWNQRDQAWFFDLLAEDEDPIVSGVKIVLGTILGGRCADERMPDGIMQAEDTTGTGTEARIDDIGTRVIVMFWTWAEMAAAVVLE